MRLLLLLRLEDLDIVEPIELFGIFVWLRPLKAWGRLLLLLLQFLCGVVLRL